MLPQELIEEILLYLPFEISSRVYRGMYLTKYVDISNFGSIVGYNDDVKSVWQLAAIDGNLDLIKWFEKNNIGEFHENVLDYAAENGRLDIIKYLEKYCRCRIGRCECYSFSIVMAAETGHIDVIKYLVHKTSYRDSSAMYNAAMYGHLDILKYLHANNYSHSRHVLKAAARNGHVETTKWIMENLGDLNIDDAMIKTALCSEINTLEMMSAFYKKDIDSYLRMAYYENHSGIIEEYMREHHILYD